VDFHSLPIPEPVLQGIDALGFQTCTPIQEKTLPLSLAGKDVAGQAQTGTGKTAAFLITIFTRLLRHKQVGPGPRALVIAPTRELALQILHDGEELGRFTGLKLQAVYGGVDYAKQRDELREGCDVLIGTPGRLIDYFKQRVYHLRQVETLVIDEADRMFDMGFIADLRFMLRRLPRYDQRQSMLFSATLSWAVMELAYEHMNDPVKVEVTPEQVTAENVEHILYHVGRHEKLPLLLGLLQHDQPKRALIFVNTKREAEWLTNRLEDNGHDVKALTGDLNQRIRLKVVRSFKSGELPILVATDVASRGLHVEGVTHVINYDVPQDPEDYVHRIGRTARAGASGKALTLACENYVMALESIEGLIGFKLPTVHVEDHLLVKPIPPSHRPRSSHGRPKMHPPRRSETRAAAAPDGRRRRRRRKPGGQAAGRVAAE
jgi:ATP-dependent RNA helicase RhlB